MVLVVTNFYSGKKNKTFGQMRPSQKFKIDHRFKAFKKLKISLKNFPLF